MENQTAATIETTNPRAMRFRLTENAVLSQSTWREGNAFKFAIAVLRKGESGWYVDGETAIEGAIWAERVTVAAIEEADTRRQYAIIDISKPMIEKEMGCEAPIRFYRDNILERFSWR